MLIQISGRHLDVGDSLRQHIEDHLRQTVEKYFARPTEANVTVSREGHLFRSDCLVHAARGLDVRARGQAEDVYAAFDSAVEKLEKQLRRYKRRIKNHHASKQDAAAPPLMAQSYVLALGDEPEAEQEAGAAAGKENDQPLIIAETSTEIPRVSVGDAVMLLDLSDMPALMFRNIKSDELNMVYRRTDGNIGWIDPSSAIRPIVR